MKVEIEIDTSNAAFEDNPGELGDILKQAATEAKYLIEEKEEGRELLRDSNGNTVGCVEVFDE